MGEDNVFEIEIPEAERNDYYCCYIIYRLANGKVKPITKQLAKYGLEFDAMALKLTIDRLKEKKLIEESADRTIILTDEGIKKAIAYKANLGRDIKKVSRAYIEREINRPRKGR